MLRLRDIMTTDILSVSPELSIHDAITMFARRHVSGAPVLSGRRVVGVVSSTDLMDFVASLRGIPSVDQEASDVDPPNSEVDEMDWDANGDMLRMELWMRAGKDLADETREVDGQERNILEEHTVAEVMTRAVLSLPPGTPVPVAADRMRTAGVHRVLVMHGDRLLGIATTKDIADAVADNKLTTRKYVFSPKAHASASGWQW